MVSFGLFQDDIQDKAHQTTPKVIWLIKNRCQKGQQGSMLIELPCWPFILHPET